MHTYQGYTLIIEQPKPRVQLSQNVPVTEEFRAKTNQWMIEFFGYFEMLTDGKVVVLEQTKTMIMNVKTYQRLMEAEKHAAPRRS